MRAPEKDQNKHSFPDESKIHRRIDLPQQVILRHQQLDRYQLKLLLLHFWLFQHVLNLKNFLPPYERLSGYLCQQPERLRFMRRRTLLAGRKLIRFEQLSRAVAFGWRVGPYGLYPTRR
jgi:hypothetical protein